MRDFIRNKAIPFIGITSVICIFIAGILGIWTTFPVWKVTFTCVLILIVCLGLDKAIE